MIFIFYKMVIDMIDIVMVIIIEYGEGSKEYILIFVL